jgi:hypothetical protein
MLRGKEKKKYRWERDPAETETYRWARDEKGRERLILVASSLHLHGHRDILPRRVAQRAHGVCTRLCRRASSNAVLRPERLKTTAKAIVAVIKQPHISLKAACPGPRKGRELTCQLYLPAATSAVMRAWLVFWVVS